MILMVVFVFCLLLVFVGDWRSGTCIFDAFLGFFGGCYGGVFA